MSNTDSFIDEVTEEVRRDKLFAVMRKYGWIGIVAVLGIVGGAAWNEWQKARADAAAQAFGDAVLSALQAEDPVNALAALDVGGERGVVRDLLASAMAHDAGDRDTALARLMAISGDASLPESYRQLAGIKAVILAGDAMPAAERDAMLGALAKPGAPYRVLALEQQALVLVADGQTDAAVAALRAILQEPDLTDSLQGRVSQLIIALGAKPEAG